MAEDRYKILYIDDEFDNLTTFRTAFRWDYDILTARSPFEGLELLENNEIHLIISDQRMPDLSGTGFFQLIHKRYPNLIKIILSGFCDRSVLKALDENIIYKYITKPWEEEEVKQVIEEAFSIVSNRSKSRSR